MADTTTLDPTSVLLWDTDRPPPLPPKPNGGRAAANSVLRVLWWNVQFGATGRAIEEATGRNPLLGNLATIAELPPEYAPDVILLGECERDTASGGGGDSDDVACRIDAAYPYRPTEEGGLWPYNPDAPERGLTAFSRRPFAVRRTELLDYYPPDLSEDTDAGAINEYKRQWREDFPPERFFPRTYINLEISADDSGGETDGRGDSKNLHLVPFHALQHIEKEFRQVGDSFMGRLWIKLRFVFGKSNPLVHQLVRLRDCLRRDFGSPAGGLEGAPFVLVGDFNLVHRIGGVLTPYPYTVLSEGLVDLMEADRSPTWPMPSDPEFGASSMAFQFDHALASPSVGCHLARVLPLQGSDHAAILLDVDA